jgi:hypothetical protein
MLISLLHPSRGRPEKAHETAKKWIENAGSVRLEYILSCDSNDHSLGLYDELKGAQNLRRIVNDNKSVVEATNHAAKVSNGEILIYLSDDFDCFPDWGKAVISEFENENRPLLIKVDDLLQPMHVPVLTIPIMNRSLYEKLGYFWHPEYKSMHVDVDLYHTVKGIGALKNCPNLKFEHQHVSVGKAQDDETYRRSSANWNQGLEVLNRRKKLKFPV